MEFIERNQTSVLQIVVLIMSNKIKINKYVCVYIYIWSKCGKSCDIQQQMI